MSLIRLKNVSVRYDDRQVLKEVFFRVGEKDRVGLIGKNGSGKTTLLKVMLGREEPNEGQVELARGVARMDPGNVNRPEALRTFEEMGRIVSRTWR